MFNLIKKEMLKEIKSEGFLYEHSSGAKLIHIKNDDENKVFSATFKTPPFDDTGVFHIIEHCVLCGSKKYNLKDPFNELVKSSLNTYLNAITYPDKTIYPVASCNKKDFINLMRVYLDAVFNPLIAEREEIFLQEGWHIEKHEDKLRYNGIVYNEMKGANDLDRQAYNFIMEELFPDNSYGYSSGGKPEAITKLSYESFLKTYEKYYNPTNCYMYLYGDLDFNEAISIISDEYLNKNFPYGIKPKIAKQHKFKNPITTYHHYISVNDEKHLIAAYVIGEINDIKNIDGFAMLAYLLASSASPLKKRLRELGSESTINFNSGLYQPVFDIMIKSANCDIEKLKKVINEVLIDLYENGIDRKLIYSTINKFEFFINEKNYGYKPKGLGYNLKLLNNWLHDFDPFAKISQLKTLNEIRDSVESNFFEKLIKKYLLDNTHSTYITLNPTNLKSDEIPTGVSAKDLEKTKKLNDYQNREDSQDIISKIPHIEIADIKKEITKLKFEQVHEKLLIVEANADVSYTNFMFDTSGVKYENLSYIGLLSYLLGKLDTKSFSYSDLSNEVNYYLGEISFYFDNFNFADGNFAPKFVISTKALNANFEKTLYIVKDIILNTIFKDKKRIKGLLVELKSKLEKSFISNGNEHAVARVKSYISEANVYNQFVKGMERYYFLFELLKDFDKNWAEIMENILYTSNQIFTKQNLYIATNNNLYKNSSNQNIIEAFINDLPDRNLKYISDSLEKNLCNCELFTNASQVFYNVKAGNFIKLGYDYKGHMAVLSQILNTEYLMNEIRLKGGAYGCHIGFNREGIFYIYSYRDGNLKRTLDIYDKIPEFIDNLSYNSNDLKKYIIGTINKYDKPYHESRKIDIATKMHILGISDDLLQKERVEVLQTNIHDLKPYANLLREALSQNNICVFGNESSKEISNYNFKAIYKC